MKKLNYNIDKSANYKYKKNKLFNYVISETKKNEYFGFKCTYLMEEYNLLLQMVNTKVLFFILIRNPLSVFYSNLFRRSDISKQKSILNSFSNIIAFNFFIFKQFLCNSFRNTGIIGSMSFINFVLFNCLNIFIIICSNKVVPHRIAPVIIINIPGII